MKYIMAAFKGATVLWETENKVSMEPLRLWYSV